APAARVSVSGEPPMPSKRGFTDEKLDIPRRSGFHPRHVIVVSESVVVVVIGFLECRNAVLTWPARRV
ncbi:MAG: hypothetical protein R6U13_14435, partial [Desulfatiglandaceae bacterium]